MCRHIYDWNIVNCDVKQQIQLNSIPFPMYPVCSLSGRATDPDRSQFEHCLMKLLASHFNKEE